MGRIKKLSESELVGGTQNTDLYPITSVKAVFDDKNTRLDTILGNIEQDKNAYNRHVFTNNSKINKLIKELYVPNKEFSYLQGKTCSIDIQKDTLHQSKGMYNNL